MSQLTRPESRLTRVVFEVGIIVVSILTAFAIEKGLVASESGPEVLREV